MASAEDAFEKLCSKLVKTPTVEAGQLFGKRCLKVSGKAFLALQKDVVAFKLEGTQHAKALGLEGAMLWDPSGKGRPMKEWVALPASSAKSFASLAQAAHNYVSKLA